MLFDVNCINVDMPSTIKSFTVYNSDMTYTIVLNSRLTREQRLISYHHEIQHIERGDYDHTCDVGLLELCAHQ